MGVRSKSEPRRTETLSGGGGGGDLIGDLSDDLLVRILELLPDARAVLRTHALSRRWRGLWTRVTALRFNSKSRREFSRRPAGAQRFIAFVNDALALRATQQEPDVKHLTIMFDIFDHEKAAEKLLPPCIEAAQGWIHYATQHGVESLTFDLYLPWLGKDEEDDEGNVRFIENNPVISLDGLASSAKLETMRLQLSDAVLRLPPTVEFASLRDLSLENMQVEAGHGHVLARLVSSGCCPRLRKLRLADLLLPMEEPLLIDAGELSHLSVKEIDDLKFLELRTPSLRVLHVQACYELEGLKVSASRLEDLKLLVHQRPLLIDADGDLSSVGRLKIDLCSHGYLYDDKNNASISLLKRCRSTRCLEVYLEVPEIKDQDVDIIKGWIPQLPHVTSLTIDVTLLDQRRSYAAGVSSLLAQCSSIRYLSLELDCRFIRKKEQPKLDLSSDNPGQWKSHELSLAHLQEVEFKNLMGTDDELQFIRFILTRATGIQKVDISFNREYWRKGSNDASQLIPTLAGGSWTTCNGAFHLSYKWRRCVYEWIPESGVP